MGTTSPEAMLVSVCLYALAIHAHLYLGGGMYITNSIRQQAFQECGWIVLRTVLE